MERRTNHVKRYGSGFFKEELHGLPEEPDASKDLSFISIYLIKVLN